MPYRVNGQYIMEGLASSFLFSLGGLGFVVLERTKSMDSKVTPKLNRILLLAVGFICVIISYITCLIFMRMKLPWVSSELRLLVILGLFGQKNLLTEFAESAGSANKNKGQTADSAKSVSRFFCPNRPIKCYYLRKFKTHMQIEYHIVRDPNRIVSLVLVTKLFWF